MRHLTALCVHDEQFAGGDELHALSRFDHRALLGRQAGVLGPRLANRNERCRLRQPVHVREPPAEVALDPLDGRCGRGRAGRDDADVSRRFASNVLGSVRQKDEHRRCGAEHRDALSRDQVEHDRGVDPGQADVHRADRRHRPCERPSVGVKHRQRPEVAIRG